MASIFAFSVITSANGQPSTAFWVCSALLGFIPGGVVCEIVPAIDRFDPSGTYSGPVYDFPIPRFYSVVSSGHVLVFPSAAQPDTVPLFRYVQYEDRDIRKQPVSFQFTIRDRGRLTNDGYWFSGIAGYVYPSQPPAPPGAVPLSHYYNPVFDDHAYTGNRADDLWRATGYEFKGQEGFVMPISYDASLLMSRLWPFTFGGPHHHFSSIHAVSEINQFSVNENEKSDFCSTYFGVCR